MIDNLPEHEFSYPGERFQKVYTPEVSKDGIVKLTVTDRTDLKEYYNSFREDCDPNVLIARYAAGDETALQRGRPVFMDCVGAPSSLAEAYALNIKAADAFEKLPPEVKEAFGNNFYRFLSEAGTEDWFNILKISKDSTDVKESDTSSAES